MKGNLSTRALRRAVISLASFMVAWSLVGTAGAIGVTLSGMHEIAGIALVCLMLVSMLPLFVAQLAMDFGVGEGTESTKSVWLRLLGRTRRFFFGGFFSMACVWIMIAIRNKSKRKETLRFVCVNAVYT